MITLARLDQLDCFAKAQSESAAPQNLAAVMSRFCNQHIAGCLSEHSGFSEQPNKLLIPHSTHH